MNTCPTGPTGPPGVTGPRGPTGSSNIALRYDDRAIWVSPLGNDSTMQVGNINRPALTIQFALSQLLSGMTLYVFGADYTSEGTINVNKTNVRIVGLSNPEVSSMNIQGTDIRLSGFIVNGTLALSSLTRGYIDTITSPLVTLNACVSVRVERSNLETVSELSTTGNSNYVVNNIFRSSDIVVMTLLSGNPHRLTFKDNIIFVDPSSEFLRLVIVSNPGQPSMIAQSNLVIADPDTSLNILIDPVVSADATSIVNVSSNFVSLVPVGPQITDVLTKMYTSNVQVFREISGTVETGVTPLSHSGKIDTTQTENALTGTVIITTSPSTYTLPPVSDGRIIELISQGLPSGLAGVTVNGGNIIRGTDSFSATVTSVVLTGRYAKFQYSQAANVWVLAQGP